TMFSLTVPAPGATMGISLFIASMTITTSSSSTWSPACFSILKILPTIGASTLVAKDSLLLINSILLLLAGAMRRHVQRDNFVPFSRVSPVLSMTFEAFTFVNRERKKLIYVLLRAPVPPCFQLMYTIVIG